MSTPRYARVRIEIWRTGAKQIDDISEDVVNEMIIDKPVLEYGIAGAHVKLHNHGNEYTNNILFFDVIKIYLWRDGDSEKKEFEGYVVKREFEGDYNSNEFYMHVYAEDYGQEFHAPPSMFRKSYVNTLGTNIIKAVLDTLNDVTSYTYIDPAADMESLHTIDFDEVTPYEAIMEILKKGQDDPVTFTGFDGYVDADKYLHVFKKGKYNSSVTPVNLEYVKVEDMHQTRGKITIYGAAKRKYPPGGDELTDDEYTSYGSWAPTSGSTTVTLDGSKYILGDKCIKVDGGGTGQDWYGAKFTFSAGKEVEAYWPKSFAELSFYVCADKDYVGTIYILLDDNQGTPAQVLKMMTIERPKPDKWEHVNIPCGRQNESSWRPWSGTFDWKAIKAIDIRMDMTRAWPSGYKTGPFWLECLAFGKANFLATVSKGSYTNRVAKPRTNIQLESNLECEKEAESILTKLSVAVGEFKVFKMEGNHDLVQGDMLNISTKETSGYKRMLKIRHEVHYTLWDSYVVLEA